MCTPGSSVTLMNVVDLCPFLVRFQLAKDNFVLSESAEPGVSRMMPFP